MICGVSQCLIWNLCFNSVVSYENVRQFSTMQTASIMEGLKIKVSCH